MDEMAKTPVAVTAAEWKKAKPVTLRDPGLDKKLAEWDKVKKEIDTKPSKATYQRAGSALKDVVTMAKTTEGACNKTLHKDGIAFLAGYPAAIAKISTSLQKTGMDYGKKVQAYGQKRVDCLAGMKKLEPVGNKLVEKIDNTQKLYADSVGTPNQGRAVKLAQQQLKEIHDFKEKAKAVLDTVRIAGNANESIHVDDRDDKWTKMFTDAINIQAGLEGEFRSRIAFLEKYINDNK